MNVEIGESRPSFVDCTKWLDIKYGFDFKLNGNERAGPEYSTKIC